MNGTHYLIEEHSFSSEMFCQVEVHWWFEACLMEILCVPSVIVHFPIQGDLQ